MSQATFDTAPPPRRGNLWARALSDFWSDPKNVIGPPGALVRRIFKLLWFVLAIYILIWVATPLQVASWQLWMTDDQLAIRVGWTFTLASALGFAIVRYAAEASEPLKVPVFLPIFTVAEGKFKGIRIETARLHMPVPTVIIGSIMVAALYFISLLGLWNLYLHEQQTTGGASVAALSGSTDRVGEAEAALAAHATATTGALAIIDQGIRETSAGSPTGRSRLVRQRTELMTESGAETRRLQAELRAARSETVTTHQTFSDPRPVDAQVAGAGGWARPVTASVLDLLRSATIEMLLVMGAGLSLVGATSRVGVPVGGDAAARQKLEPETVAPTTARAEEAAEPPPARRRFTLPVATDEDYALAAAIGPTAWAPPAAVVETPEPEAPADEVPEPIVDEPATATETEAKIDEEIDPLVAEQLREEQPAV